MVFKIRMLRRIFEPQKDKEIRGWRKFHNDELYSSPVISRMIK
jgi:hypothetical protein